MPINLGKCQVYLRERGISIFRRIDNVLFDQLRKQYIDALEREIPADCKSILDVGCGNHSPLSCISRVVPYSGFDKMYGANCQQEGHYFYS